MRASVIGGGSWGSAFARYLARIKVPTTLWVREPEIIRQLEKTRENKTFLPGFKFPSRVNFTTNLRESLRSADIVFIAVPSQFCRPVYAQMAPHLGHEQIVVSLTKGIDQRSLHRMTQVMEDVFRPYARPRLAVLSGPSFAREVAAGHPTALVAASHDMETARTIQHLLSSLTIRVYRSRDVTGVEIAGALKNVIAIAAGAIDAMDFGLNSRAALITRGLVEITQLGLSLGAVEKTFSGLAGIGDLVLTCTGELSRNHYVGYQLGKGKTLDAVLSRMKMVAEGVHTTIAANRLSRIQKVEMPITHEIYQVLYRNKPPRRALDELMSRALREE
jgi:glycerol-3-phosphate dehydrogenase (NAD(P)+)